MSDKYFKLNIDISEITKEFESIKKEVAEAVQTGAESLAHIVHAKINEIATDKLNTRAKTYKENVTFEEVQKNVWIVTLLEPAMWIEDGQKPYDMKETLLAKNAKIGKTGKRYKHIPMDKAKPPSQQSENANKLTNQIKEHLRANKIPFRKIEVDEKGSPRLGLLHKFSLASDKPSVRSKDPVLKNVQIYQTKDSTGNIRRDVMTFRTISDNSDNWQHPGLEGVNIFEDAYEWALKEWETKILPDILAGFDKK
jgi:hypothetical protein